MNQIPTNCVVVMWSYFIFDIHFLNIDNYNGECLKPSPQHVTLKVATTIQMKMIDKPFGKEYGFKMMFKKKFYRYCEWQKCSKSFII